MSDATAPRIPEVAWASLAPRLPRPYFGQYIQTATPNMATVAKCARKRHGRDRMENSP